MKKVFNPGEYHNRVQILRRKEISDEYGQLIDEWEVFKSLYASKQQLLGKEFYEAQTTESRVEAKFNMRYTPAITPEMRLRHGAEIYEIIGLPVEIEKRELVCYCRLVRQ